MPADDTVIHRLHVSSTFLFHLLQDRFHSAANYASAASHRHGYATKPIIYANPKSNRFFLPGKS